MTLMISCLVGHSEIYIVYSRYRVFISPLYFRKWRPQGPSLSRTRTPHAMGHKPRPTDNSQAIKQPLSIRTVCSTNMSFKYRGLISRNCWTFCIKIMEHEPEKQQHSEACCNHHRNTTSSAISWPKPVWFSFSVSDGFAQKTQQNRVCGGPNEKKILLKNCISAEVGAEKGNKWVGDFLLC